MASIIEKIAKMTGKSVDEVSQYLSKITGGAREIDMGDIKSPPMKRGRPSKTPPASQPVNPNEIDVGPIDPVTIKKGRPAKSPYIDPNEIDLGKTKNKLEIGDSPSSPVSVNEIDAGDINGINPNIDDYRLPITSTGTSTVGGGKVPSVIDDISDEANSSLVTRKSTIPTEVGPQVLGKGTSRLSSKADDVIDAEIINKMPEGPLKTALLKKLGLAGLGAAGIAGGLALLSDKDESPSVDITPVAINGAPDQDSIASGAKGSATQKEQGKSLESLGEELKSEQTREPSSDRLAYMDMMQNAQQAASQNRLQAALLKAGMQAGAAIAGPGVKADYTAAEALAEAAGTPVSNVKGLMETEAGAKKLKELERQEQEEADLKDPNSQISRFYREKFGPFIPGITKDTSAFAMQKALPQLTQLINVREAATARREAREDSKLSKLEETEKQNKEKRKLVTEEVEGFRSNIKQNIARARELLDKAGTFELFGSEAEELNALMDEMSTDMAKLQDPKSVARPTEVKLVRKNLVPEGGLSQLGMSNATALDLLNQFEKRVDVRANTAYGVRGLDVPKTSQLTTPSISPVAISDETREKRIKFVMDQNNVSREEAIAALQEAGKL